MDTQRGLERLVNFGDAVVAIAATLLVLPLADLVEPVTVLVQQRCASHVAASGPVTITEE